MVSMRIMLAVGLMFTPLLTEQEKRLTFEVASIKPTKPGGRGGGMRVMPGGQEFVSQGMSLKFIIAFMYWVPMRRSRAAWRGSTATNGMSRRRQTTLATWTTFARCFVICWRTSSS
jgi:hypothetical protein